MTSRIAAHPNALCPRRRPYDLRGGTERGRPIFAEKDSGSFAASKNSEARAILTNDAPLTESAFIDGYRALLIVGHKTQHRSLILLPEKITNLRRSQPEYLGENRNRCPLVGRKLGRLIEQRWHLAEI